MKHPVHVSLSLLSVSLIPALALAAPAPLPSENGTLPASCTLSVVDVDVPADQLVYQQCCLSPDGDLDCTVLVEQSAPPEAPPVDMAPPDMAPPDMAPPDMAPPAPSATWTGMDAPVPADSSAFPAPEPPPPGGDVAPPADVPAPAAPAAMAACDIHLGHEISQCTGYDIWSANCHTAANNFCRLNPDKIDRIGILSCMGLVPSSPAGHTANWEVKPDGTACIYNWGQPCCWATDGAVPPDISQGQGQVCAQRACGSQYGADTTVPLPAGQLVETPGHAVCAGSQAMRDQFGASASGCFSCCDYRADYWNGWCRPAPLGGVGPTLSVAQCFDQQQTFLQQCKTLCNGYYEAGQSQTANQTLAERQGQACYAATSMWSAASYYEQCRGCCLDKAGRTYVATDYPACVAQCGSP